ncbi:hypothetical protein ACFL4G_06170 [Thermodesulfobacteriota bacterium]
MMQRARMFLFLPAFLFLCLFPMACGPCPWPLQDARADDAGIAVGIDSGDEADGWPGFHVDMRTELGDIVRYGQDYEVRPDEAVEGKVTVIWGDLIVDGRVSGDTTAILGELSVDGVVGGDASAVWGDVELLEHASIGGDAISVGGRLRISPDAAVGGRKLVLARFLEEISPFAVVRGGAGLGAFAWMITWILFLGLTFPIVRFMSGQVDAASQALRDRKFRSFWLGALFATAAIGLPVVFLLSFAGLPAGLVLSLVSLSLYCFGRIVIASVLGGWILNRLRASSGRGFRSTAIGYTVVRLVEVVPVLGAVVKLVLLNVAFGCVTIALWRWRLARRRER